MQELFSSTGLRAQDRYRKWREFADERFMPMLHTRTAEDAFYASASGVDIGDLAITRASFDALILEATQQTISHPLNKPDVLGFSINLAGKCTVDQYDRCIKQGAGHIAIVDANKPFKFVHQERTDHLIIQIPRRRLENILGSARNFAALAMQGSVTTILVKSFFRNLVRIHSSMPPETARKMADIGIDLVVASVAERMNQELPRHLHDTLAVQAAKSFVEANLGSVSLDPSQIAAAAGVSLRRLQMLFRERGRHVADWIWQRRLEVAAERLADPALAHMSFGAVSYGCGFVNQAHFSRRFKAKFGLSPSDYRRRAFATSRTPERR